MNLNTHKNLIKFYYYYIIILHAPYQQNHKLHHILQQMQELNQKSDDSIYNVVMKIGMLIIIH